MKFITWFTLLCSFAFLMSCGGSDVLGDCSDILLFNNTIAEETDKLTEALTSFSVDQSTSNCDNLKNAYGTYINSLQGLQGCADDLGLGEEFRNSIVDAELSLNTIGGC